MDDRRLGQILLRLDLVTQEQLDHCMKALDRLRQAEAEAPPPEDEDGDQEQLSLASVLVDQGILDAKTLVSVERMNTKKIQAEIQEEDDRVASVRSRLVDADLEELLRLAREMGASDLHLTPGEPPTVRMHGELQALDAGVLDGDSTMQLLRGLMTEERQQVMKRHRYVDFAIAVPNGGRFRANVFKHSAGIGGIFRVIAEHVTPFEELNIPDVVQDFVHFTHGLVLVTGATGSGKSTTLASLVDILNDTYQLHVISLEDPIEVVHESRRALITQREIGSHCDSFANGLRSALREDPDVIVVGEMRDMETVSTALTAAETGHLVMGTLHTRDAYSTIQRVIDQFPVHKRTHVRSILARVLRAVVCQDLIPTADGEGRILASEVMVVNPAISNLIREDRSWQINSVIQMSGQNGMQLMDDCLENLVREGYISRRAANVRAAEKERFQPEAAHTRG